MAGAGFKTFNTGDVLTASDVNTYLMQQTVMVFDDAAARTSALGANVAEGMFSYLKDTNLTYRYDGSSWLSDAGTTSPLTTKGDVWGYSTTDARIPVGADGTILTADSNETLGVKWAAAAAGGFVGCSLYASANISVANDSSPLLTWDSERFDTDSFHSTVSNTSRITIPSGKGGKYLFMFTGGYAANANGYRGFSLFKNGANYLYLEQIADLSATISPFMHGATIVEASAGDYFELGTNQTSGGNLNFFGSITYNDFSCVYLGA